MAEINHAVKGTGDILPENIHKYQYIEKVMLDTALRFGFREIRVPVFEHTEVFSRNVGETTDVVQKEMYTFLDKGGRSITLRPELTAGTVRSVIEHGLLSGLLPQKVCYIGGCYRYEKPQAGRLREFHQFGVECFGAADAAADAEIISLANEVLKNAGIKSIHLEINSIGCPECRKEYQKALKAYFTEHIDELCDTCKERLERNPMRILDCKSPVCSKIAQNAPKVTDFLCEECSEHFEKVKKYLTAEGIEYTVNPNIVRGLDYYTRTVFEFISGDIGAQSTVCGGGRYDGLVRQMGGPDIPALGFAIGIERLMLLLENTKTEMPEAQKCELYIAPMGESAKLKALELCAKLREDGFFVQPDISSKGLKAQMKYADKTGALYSTVIGEDELAADRANIKNMASGDITEVALSNICEDFSDIKNRQALLNLENSIEGVF